MPGSDLRFSVVITCYREGDLLKKAYQSLLNQTDRDFEIIIVNDCSPDERTNEICKSLQNEAGVKVIFHEKNGGLAAARKTGYAAMSGDVCIPLDADDILPPYAIDVIRKGFKQFPEAGFIFGNYEKVDVAKGITAVEITKSLANDDSSLNITALARNWILLGTSPCKKAIFEEIGGASQQFSYDIDDMDYWIKVIEKGYKGYYINETIYTWNRQPTGMNYNLKGDKMLELFLAHKDFFIQNHAAKGFQNTVYGPYLKVADMNGLKKAANVFVGLGESTAFTKFIEYCPAVVLKVVYRFYRKWKYKTV